MVAETEERAYSGDDLHFELNTMLDDLTRAGMRITNQWKEMWLTAMRYAWVMHSSATVKIAPASNSSHQSVACSITQPWNTPCSVALSVVGAGSA